MAYKVPSGWQNKVDSSVRYDCDVRIYGGIGASTLICNKTNISQYTYKGYASWVVKDIPTYEIHFTILKWTTFPNKSYLNHNSQIAVKYVVGNLETTGYRWFRIYNMEYDYNQDTMTIYANSLLTRLTSSAHYTLGQNTSTLITTMLGLTFDNFYITKSFSATYLPYKLTQGELLQQIALCNYSSYYTQEDDFYMESYDEIDGDRTYSEIKELNILSALTKSISDLPTSVNVGEWINDTELADFGTASKTVPTNPTPAEIFVSVPFSSQAFTTLSNCVFKKNGIIATPTSWNVYNDGVTARVQMPTGNATYTLEVNGYRQNQETKQVANALTISTPLQINADIDTMASSIVAYYSYNQVIEFDCRIDPRIEPLDLLFIYGKDLFVYVESVDITFNGGFSGKIKGRVNTDITIQPLRVDNKEYDPYDEDYAFRIHNDNVFPVKVKIHYSGGTIDMGVVGGKTYLDVSNGNCPQLLQSFRAKDMQDLNDDVYCYCEKGNLSSTNTIILEAD